MEVVGGVLIKEIFNQNDNWFNFVEKFNSRIRDSVHKNVQKVLKCKVSLGFIEYVCNSCGEAKRVYLTCKSRFC